MKNKFVIILIFLGIMFIPSIIKFVSMNSYINEKNYTKLNLTNTNLSIVKIEGYKLGDKVYKLDFRSKYPHNPVFNTEIFTYDANNNQEVSYLGNFFIKNGEIVKINVDLTLYDVLINDRKVTSVEEVVKNLGDNYSTDIENFSSYYNTYTYIDQINNLEIHVADIYKDKSKPIIVIQRIDTSYNDKLTSIKLQHRGSLGFAWALYEIAFYPFYLCSSSSYINPLSLLYMPIVYFIIFLPTMLAIIMKQYRRINIAAQLLIFFIILFGVFIVICQQ